MKIGIVGAGNVGSSLGRLWAERGHGVTYGVRDPVSPRVAALGPEARVVGLAEAVQFGEVVVIAVPSAAVDDVIRHGGDWAGKIVIDATNRMTPTPGGPPSVAEEIAAMAPGARVVKAFNTIGAEQLARPDFGGMVASIFLCGDDAVAKATVSMLAEELGFDVIDAGPLAYAGMLESLARLWVSLARSGLGRDIAFRLLRR
jgi:predicted dinucleotide-binding enzyme